MPVTVQQLELADILTPVLDTGGTASEAVLFLHGNPGCGRDWSPLMEQVEPFARALAPDMPGFGRAAKPEDFDYTVAGYAAHIAALVDALGLEKVLDKPPKAAGVQKLGQNDDVAVKHRSSR